MMKLAITLILIVSSSYAQVDFYSRVRNFSVELIHFTQIKTNGNVVLAPFSLWSLLSQVAYESEQKTRIELLRTLITNVNVETYSSELKNLTAILKEKSDGVTFINDNFVLLHKSLKLSPHFINRMRYYQANILSLDFRESTSARLSNILTKTNPNIPSVFGDSDFVDSEMIMANVFFLKGAWSTPFNKSNTFIASTYNQDGTVNGSLPMMSQELTIPQSDMKVLEAVVSELSFGIDGKYCMLIINPHEGVSVTKVYRHLSEVTFKNIFDKLQSDVQEFGLKNVTFKLPKFEIEKFLVLNRPLIDMGIYDAFNPEKAYFGKLSSENLYIDTIEQRSKISVTEDGIEAFSTIPANLEIAIQRRSIMGQPFIFFVVNKATMTIVLGGIYGRP